MLAASRTRKGPLSEIVAEQLGTALPQRALIVEANPTDLVYARMALAEVGFTDIDVAITLRHAYEKVKDSEYQFILTDYCLPDGDGVEFLEWMDDQSDVIMLAGQIAADLRARSTTVNVAAAYGREALAM